MLLVGQILEEHGFQKVQILFGPMKVLFDGSFDRRGECTLIYKGASGATVPHGRQISSGDFFFLEAELEIS